MKRLAIIFFPISFLLAQSIDPSLHRGCSAIDSIDLKANLTVLTADSLEGRETSYPGQKKAARYIAGIFKESHLQPLGDSGTYFQHFDVEVRRIDPSSKIIISYKAAAHQYLWGQDITAESARDTILTGPAVFIGYADSELSDSVKAKLAGHIVFVFIGKREYADDTSRAMMLRRLYTFRRESNAAAILTIADTEGAATFPYIVSYFRGLNIAKGKMRLKNGKPFEIPHDVRFFVSPRLAQDALASTGLTLAGIRNKARQTDFFEPVFLENLTMTIQSRIKYETRQTENVIALLPGSDPQLRTQVVAITAHYDHLGIDENGAIYHGADDDGSGTASVMELAKAFAQNPIRPKRSILFMTVTGEEKGLFGSLYYTDHPVIPLENTIADLNIDMIGRIDPEHEAAHDENYVYVIGSDKISKELDSLLRTANAETSSMTLDYMYNDEHDPEQLYRRSDHYNFAKHDVPIVFFFTGLHADYHKPTDTIDKILFSRMKRIDELIYDLAWKLGTIDHKLRTH